MKENATESKEQLEIHREILGTRAIKQLGGTAKQHIHRIQHRKGTPAQVVDSMKIGRIYCLTEHHYVKICLQISETNFFSLFVMSNNTLLCS